jgi:hypothetical protein
MPKEMMIPFETLKKVMPKELMIQIKTCNKSMPKELNIPIETFAILKCGYVIC